MIMLKHKKTRRFCKLISIEVIDNRYFFRFDDGEGIFKVEYNSLAKINKDWEDA